MPGKRKSYQVYVAPSAKGTVKARAAARRINTQLGYKAVTIVNNKAKSDAVIRSGNPRGNYGAYTSTRGKKRDRITVDSRLLGPQGAKPKYKKNLTAHEVGHGLGLDHTTGKRNLMNANIVGTKMSGAQKKRVTRRYKKGKYS